MIGIKLQRGGSVEIQPFRGKFDSRSKPGWNAVIRSYVGLGAAKMLLL
jgi:hypothetical protein